MIHNWLPVNGHPGRANTSHNQQCPACQERKETQQHFFTCSYYREQWNTHLRSEGIQELNCEKNFLNHILHWAITNHSQQVQEFPIESVPTQYHQLIQDQHSIGWDQIIHGRWAREWVHQFDLIKPNQGEQLATAKLLSIWQVFHKIWRTRCELQHKDTETKETHQRQQMHPKVHAIYNLKHQLDHIDQRILDQDPITIINMPTRTLKDWLTRTEAFVKKGLQRAKQRLKQRNSAITMFFLPKPKHTNLPNQTPMLAHDSTQDLTQHHPPNRNAQENFHPP